MNDFVAIFSRLGSLSEDDGDDVYNGIEVENHEGCHVGKDRLNRPAILFATALSSHRQPPPILIENLQVEHNVLCHLSRRGGRLVEGRFSVVSCRSTDKSLQNYFLDIMEIITASLPTRLSAENIANAVERLIELFQAFRSTPRTTAMGLWAELFLIVTANSPLTMVRAWHHDSDERFDFSDGLQRIEVKSAGNRVRSHHFSFEQVYPPEGVEVVIASLFVEPSTNGTTIGELWDQIRTIVGSDVEMRMKIERVCVTSLGDSWSTARLRGFDYQLANQSLSFYHINNIPRISSHQPGEISDIHFRSDISAARPLKAERYRDLRPLFSAYFGNSNI